MKVFQNILSVVIFFIILITLFSKGSYFINTLILVSFIIFIVDPLKITP